jgi:hypothetical protein
MVSFINQNLNLKTKFLKKKGVTTVGGIFMEANMMKLFKNKCGQCELKHVINSIEPSQMMYKFMDEFPHKKVAESLAYRDGIIATLRKLGVDVDDHGKILKGL